MKITRPTSRSNYFQEVVLFTFTSGTEIYLGYRADRDSWVAMMARGFPAKYTSSSDDGHHITKRQALKSLREKLVISVKARLGHELVSTPSPTKGKYTLK